MMQPADEEVQQWITKAEEDIEVARIVLEVTDPPLSPVLFHCQQAVEKYLKALLIHLKIKFPLTHDLIALAELISGKIPEIEEFKELLAELNDYAVNFRYPGYEYVPSQSEAQSQWNFVNTIKQFCLDRIKL